MRQAFPDLAACVGSPEVKSRLNKSLRWIVGNALPVSTPQLYVDGRRLCEEDTDLGLEYALERLLSPMVASAGPVPGAVKTTSDKMSGGPAKKRTGKK